MKKKLKSEPGPGETRLLDSLKDLIIIYDRAGRVLYVNDTVCRSLGYQRSELLGRNVRDLVSRPFSKLLPARIKKLKAEGELLIATAYRRRGGGVYPAQTRCAMSSMGGKPCVLCIARGVTGGEKIVRDLGEARERYQRLVEGLRSEYFFYQHGRDGVFTYISPSIKDVLGYTQAQFLKHYTRYITANPVNKAVVKRTGQSLKGRQQPAYLVELLHAGGGKRMIEVLEVPVKGPGGRVEHVEGIAHDVTPRLREQAELESYRSGLENLVAERTAELKAVFDRAPVTMLLLDEKLKVVRTNASARSGRLIGEVLNCANDKDGRCGEGRNCANCEVRRAVTRTLRGEKSVRRSETVLETAAGEKFWFLLSTALIKVGAEKRLLLCLDDITRQKKADESLRKAEEFRKLILSSVGDGIIGVDNRGQILFMNESAQAMLGWKLEELRGKSLHETVHYKKPDGTPYPVSECPMFAAYTNKIETPAHDEMLWRRDGTGFYARYTADPMFNNGDPSGAVITFSDISERRRIETELRENKERLQVQNAALTELGRGKRTAASDVEAALREAASTACEALGSDRVRIWLFNEDRTALVCRVSYEKASRAVSAGPAFKRAGYPAYFRQLEEERTLVVDDAASDFRVREFRESYLRPGKVSSLLDVTISSGEKTAGVIRAERGPDARPWGLDEQNLLGAVADFAALAIAGAERVKLERMKDFLTHTIVHDLKNPLSSIICAGQLLSEDLRPKMNHGQRETLDILNSMAEEMKNMVSNILDINRIEEGKLPLKAVRFRPAVLLREAAGALKISAAHEGKRIKVSAPAAMPEVTGDLELLRRVMENLIANALKFAPGGTAVEAGAGTAPDGKTPEFYVKDRGPGVPVEYRERIFEKFVQLEDPSPRKWGGKGLGLAFCKLAVEAHGGRLWVESAPGGGSVFRFTVPPADPAPAK